MEHKEDEEGKDYMRVSMNLYDGLTIEFSAACCVDIPVPVVTVIFTRIDLPDLPTGYWLKRWLEELHRRFFGGWSPLQITWIVKSVIDGNQVYEQVVISWKRHFFRRYWSILDMEIKGLNNDELVNLHNKIQGISGVNWTCH
jgi:hypothetical protein